MTKSTITRERLAKIKSWRETYGAGSNVMLPAEEAEELARMALAAMASEPVGWTDEQELRDVEKDGCGYLFKANPITPHADPRRVILLYRHAQLAPASPVCTCPSGDGSLRWPCPVHPGNSPVIPDGYVMVPKEPTERMVIDGFESEPDETFSEPEVWEAFQKMSGCEQAAYRARLCWAAMLAAAPQSPDSDPATVPGKWIPVSEQMPEVGDIVLTAMGGVVNVGETECSAANCRFFTSVISGRELPATHWMQLPAAPQEVKGES
ncbi:TPA: DUF551 domain-containing protein [Klebsiella pneumoniae]